MRTYLKGIAGLLLWSSTSLLAAQSPASPSPQPTFRAGVEYVEVDAVVTDAQGTSVANLTRDDFEIYEDGRRQPIASFSEVDLPLDMEAATAFRAVEPDAQSNDETIKGRVYVMVLDDLHVDPQRSQNVRQASRRFVEQYLGAHDRMAVIYTGRDDAAQEFTNSRQMLVAAVDQFAGRRLQSPTMAADSIERARADIPADFGRDGGFPSRDHYEAERSRNAESLLSTLRQVGQWLDAVRDRRKAVLLFSEGLDYDMNNLLDDSYVNGRERSLAALRDTLAAMMRTNIVVYGLDPRGLAAGADAIEVSGLAAGPAALASLNNEARLSLDNLRELSDQTGGFASVNRNDTAVVFDRIVRDSSAYYALAYYPAADASDGRVHRIEVKVTRPGLSVRARRGYVGPAGSPAVAARAGGSGAADQGRDRGRGADNAIQDALRSPLPVSGLGLRVFAAPLKASKKSASVVVGIEVNGSDLTFGANNRVDLSLVVTDRRSKVRASRRDALPLDLPPDDRVRAERSAMRLVNRVELPPGRYRVRVAARDAGRGSVGSVFADIDVPDFYKQPLSMSGLMVTSQAGSDMMTAVADDQLRNLLPSPVIALRTFGRNDELDLFAEIYDNTGKTPHRIDVTTSVLGREGQPVAESTQAHESSESAGERQAIRYREYLPLSRLLPGDYVLKVEVRSSAAPGVSATRSVPFEVAQAGR